MLKKNQKIAKNADFRKIAKEGQRIYGDGIVVFFRANNLSETRFGFSVSAKAYPKAVSRNRAKRIMRVFAGEWFKDGRIKNGLDVVISLRAKLEEKQLKQTLLNIFKKINQ